MRTRRFTITAFLLAAIMVLGIGFAALADELDINGTVEISGTQAETTFDGDVHFDSVNFDVAQHVVKTGSTQHTSNATAGGNVSFSADSDTVTFMSTTFADLGDTTAITLTIVNEYIKAVKVTAVITFTNNGDSCFDAAITGSGWTLGVDGKYTADIAASTKEGDTGAHGTTTFVFAVRLINLPEDTLNSVINVQFIADVVE